jgi:outer membrane protein OmpA-like peptidoglycan-associated protein
MKTLYLFLGLMLATTLANAQTINSHTFSFSDTLETVQVEDALGPNSELAKHRFLLRGSYDFVNESLIGIDSTRSSQQFTVVKRLHTAGVGAGWMITKRFLVGFEVPIHFVRLDQTYLTTFSLNLDRKEWVLGDINLRAKLRLTNDSSKINVAIAPHMFFPTGNDTYFVSDNSYGVGGRVLLDVTPAPFLTLYGNAGYTYAKNAEFLNIDRTGRIETAAGAYVRVIGDKLGGNAEVIHALTLPGYDEDQNPIAMRLGFRARTGIVRWYFGGALEGLRKARSNDVSLYGGIKMPLGSWEKPAPVVAPAPVPDVVTVEKKIEILKENLSVRREINFETAKDVILPGSFPELDSAAAIINEHVEHIKLITIEGHTDSRASAAYNQALSERRANSVRNYMIGKGVPAEKLKAVGYGESRLKVEETSPETLLINRRVEFKVNETIETEKVTEVETTTPGKPASE